MRRIRKRRAGDDAYGQRVTYFLRFNDALVEDFDELLGVLLEFADAALAAETVKTIADDDVLVFHRFGSARVGEFIVGHDDAVHDRVNLQLVLDDELVKFIVAFDGVFDETSAAAIAAEFNFAAVE